MTTYYRLAPDGPAYPSEHVTASTRHLADPVAVIDFSDREQARRLASLYMSAEDDGRVAPTGAMQAALREYATPTPKKPPEPTGLGAVVEDNEGGWWVRTSDEDRVRCYWRGPGRRWREWHDVPAVRVLSEGVPS